MLKSKRINPDGAREAFDQGCTRVLRAGYEVCFEISLAHGQMSSWHMGSDLVGQVPGTWD